ncbi:MULTISPECIES: hypothetical protein [unclassified Paraburkholderia]|uniref:hypothetical protein n=1 Tax=unclassified Paraburkholderia TaxID=2615204 RepID=UPI00160D4CEE|nr:MULTISPECIES: hypothetical protein [unclassified Paraburkholderia]MBB5407792.1 uncharacterized protein YdeI (BOF family) [Paraburkholderia sp. HC6.4b]MBB5452195.1 uncharacterized protein YdeI (BOF family) [Paraburkholderia sp. Kb1A]
MKKTFLVLFAFLTSTSVLAQSNLPQQLPSQQPASAGQPSTKQLSQGGPQLPQPPQLPQIPQLPTQASTQVPTQLSK